MDTVQAGTRITWVGAAANVALVAIKIGGGLAGGSAAVVADGFHSLSDLLSDLVVLVGLRLGARGPDESHPFGHRRLETMASAWVGLILVATAVVLMVDAARSLIHGETSHPTGLALVVTVLSLVVKEGLFQWTLRVGRAIRSPSVVANAWHHRSDAYSSVGVLVGVGAAMLFPAWAWLDGVAAFAVGGLVLHAGWEIVRDASREMTDRAPDAEVVREIAARIDATDRVVGHHALKVRAMGGQLLIQVHVVVDGALTVGEGHDIAEGVEVDLLSMPDVLDVIVHVDPDGDDRSDEVEGG
ncbi:MAG: cation transporter [Deltaproteobacteria bacterium]|nr:cation transporter [Deltaproteobacteria bacterium]